MTTFVDVGANHGLFALSAARSGAAQVIAIEPIPSLADEIETAAQAQDLTAVAVVRSAVALEEGVRFLNVSTSGDMGISSLLALREDLSSDAYWATRTDLNFNHDITVEVAPLSALLAPFALDVIDFIKIDCQGMDLDVLKSLGDGLARLRGGMLEAATTCQTALYSDEAATLIDVLEWLREAGFAVYAVKPNDPALNEVNVYFCRAEEDWRQFERELRLNDIALYSDRHYWHCPAPSPAPESSPVIAPLRNEIVQSTEECRRLSSHCADQSLKLEEQARMMWVLTQSAERAMLGEASARAAAEAAREDAAQRFVDQISERDEQLAALQLQLDAARQELSALQMSMQDQVRAGDLLQAQAADWQNIAVARQAALADLTIVSSEQEARLAEESKRADLAVARADAIAAVHQEALRSLEVSCKKLEQSERFRSRLELRLSIDQNGSM